MMNVGISYFQHKAVDHHRFINSLLCHFVKLQFSTWTISWNVDKFTEMHIWTSCMQTAWPSDLFGDSAYIVSRRSTKFNSEVRQEWWIVWFLLWIASLALQWFGSTFHWALIGIEATERIKPKSLSSTIPYRTHILGVDHILVHHGEEMTWDMWKQDAGVCLTMTFTIESNNYWVAERASAEHLPSIPPPTSQTNIYSSVPLLTDVLYIFEHIMVAVEVWGKTGHPGGIFKCFEENVICVDDERRGRNRYDRKASTGHLLSCCQRAIKQEHMRTWASFGRPDTGEEEKSDVWGRIRRRSSQETSGNERCVDTLSLLDSNSMLTSNLLGVDYTGEEKVDIILRFIQVFIP